jgi:histidinol-phosphate/aromatic aminotransferase/cobyric acid decarboxylase-like protein
MVAPAHPTANRGEFLARRCGDDSELKPHGERLLGDNDEPSRVHPTCVPPASCYHGGAFFEAVGDSFDDLDRRHQIINADVLDAWFAPSPKAFEALTEHLSWLLRTSPPAGCEGLIRAIARARHVDPTSVLPGAGSSHLIFLALRHWLNADSRTLILDPTYGEYSHVLEQVIGCQVDRFPLNREEQYDVNLDKLLARIKGGYDLVVLVNPNSPTGRHVPADPLKLMLAQISPRTRVWIDEAYIEYAGRDQTLETFASQSPNVVVCKSLSKVYALSGVRAAYLCGPPPLIEELRPLNPPWAVSLPGQVAAVHALEDPGYYARCHERTQQLRQQMAQQLRERCGLEIVPGVANFLLCHLADDGPDAHEVVRRCRQQDLFLRDASSMGSRFGDRAVRIAVKDHATNQRIIEILSGILQPAGRSGSGTHGTHLHRD